MNSPFLSQAIADLEDRLRQSHARETEKGRKIFDLKNQNKRFREAIAFAVSELTDMGHADLQVRLNKLLRAEENLCD